MANQKERLTSLIEFAQQSAKLRSNPARLIAQHGMFALYEYQIQGFPGVHLNINGSESEDEIWLSVERLHETKPPEVSNATLRPWVQMTQGPNDEPYLLKDLESGKYCQMITEKSLDENAFTYAEREMLRNDLSKILTLDAYSKRDVVKEQFESWLTVKWRPWAEEEKVRRKTIQLYAKLFTLKQQLEGGIVEAQIELVWGMGVGIWVCNGVEVSYPIVGQLVELSINLVTASIEIRPRDMDARIEVDWYASVDNPGVADLEKTAKDFFGKSTKTFSPFDAGTYEALLRAAATHLDASGVYWPDQSVVGDRLLPKAEHNLKVTDSWVLFARPRTNSIFMQDLEKFKQSIEKIESLSSVSSAVAAVVTDPVQENPALVLPNFRGMCSSYYTEGVSSSEQEAHDLYFPKPFNDEQLRIVQLLDVSDGVVVQGPPGTGKTHTIANVICHYLAQGKRVLVTSMKDPALAVLQEHLPEEIRPLAIALLTSEQQGMKQFEHAIYKIASEVQAIDRVRMAREIHHIEETIDALHRKLSVIDHQISAWVKKNLARILIDGEELDPHDAAKELVAHIGEFEWISDILNADEQFSPQFSDVDVARLRSARRILGKDISYLDAKLPQTSDFPETKLLIEVHQDLGHFEILKQGVINGNVPSLADSGQDMFDRARELLTQVEWLKSARTEVFKIDKSWMELIRELLRRGTSEGLFNMLEVLGSDLEKAIFDRKGFIERPVFVIEDAEMDPIFMDAVSNLSLGKYPFGVKGFFGRKIQKQLLQSVKIGIAKPVGKTDWIYVKKYFDHLLTLRGLALRWNTLADELNIERVSGNTAEGGLTAANFYSLYLKIKKIVEVERRICDSATVVFPNWTHARDVIENLECFGELERALRHHITKNRLANVWVTKECFHKVLEGCSGTIVDEIGLFLEKILGNPDVNNSEMQSAWSNLMAELARIRALEEHLVAVKEVCEMVRLSGAPSYADILKTPVDGVADRFLPDNWRRSWRLRRIAGYLDSIDARSELKRLSKDRHDIEKDLSRAYHDVVVRQTWLKITEKTSPNIRSALQAYLNAIQKIGKGTGKRAVRYRQDAREAAAQANPAVPCWIMPHYRVSESLPPQFGCFDLVIIDEASQSDLTALPALLRAKKVLIVGDDKQVSPEGVGLEEEKVRSLMRRFLSDQVVTYRPQMSPERSIYDLFKVVFATSAVMLKEHFRCVGPIIEYSKREFYNHELRPLRLPRISERIDPPLVDVLVSDGYRKGDINLPEARFIVDEIKQIVVDPKMTGRSIGVVSLLADKQALAIWEMLTEELGVEVMGQYRIACGDARTFQGKERNIMFLSMVSAINDIGAPLSRDTFAQRFNVAASRARDRMYLVRSVEPIHLSDKDLLRRSLITHFSSPFAQDEKRVADLRLLCESPFEREVYDELSKRGYFITPQVRVGHYRIDLVAEGHNDARLAIECDGDRHHGPEKWQEDMQRQRVLERAGWSFWRCFASVFVRRRNEVLDDLLRTLNEHGIDPIGAEGAPRSIHSELRTVRGNFEVSKADIIPDPIKVSQKDDVVSAPKVPPASASPILGKMRLLMKQSSRSSVPKIIVRRQITDKRGELFGSFTPSRILQILLSSYGNGVLDMSRIGDGGRNRDSFVPLLRRPIDRLEPSSSI